MSLKRINEFPEGSGAISSDDIFLFMDHPNSGGITKKISLSELTNAIGIVSVSGGNADTGDITFNANVISTANINEDIILDPNGSGNVVIGTNKNLILDINAFTAEGIKIIDSTEDGYDDINIPSTLRVGSIYHSEGSMVISSDGSIIDASGVQVDETGNPVNHAIYGGLWLTNGQDTGFLVPGPTGSLREYYFGSDIEIHNNEKIWEFTQAGNLNLPVSGNVTLSNGATLALGTFDNSTGGQNGISLNCTVGYELNWQGGHLKNTADGGLTSSNILFDSTIQFPGTGISNMTVDNEKITYPDGTEQRSANISSSNITDLNSTISGLVDGVYAPIVHTHVSTDITDFASAVSGIISGVYAPVSHSHDSSNITDFNSSVSGLLPVKNIVAGTGVSVTTASGSFTINSNGDADLVKTSVFNETGSTIPKFSVVYINGGHGDQPTIALALASGEITSSKTYGVTAENIDHNSVGSVIVMGALTGLDTDQFNPSAPSGDVNGTILWLSPTVAGGVTTTKPSAPYHMVSVGTIVRTHQNEGVVEVRIQNGFEIEELHNVQISNVTHNDILVYNSGTSLWQNNHNAIFSNPSGIPGASAITNIVQISQNDYDNLSSYDPNTVYIINT